ncbi:MAG: EF-hand domain-containing protein [Pseudomonadota bacterium]|nr:EF-hand domain-containing protein [Pseudomonadota bacterium]
MRKFLFAGLVAALAVPVIAQPAPPIAQQRPMADKVMTRADIDTRVRARFARVDANRDGVLTTQEMTTQRGARMAKREARKAQRAARNPDAPFNRFDANRDGMISRDEFAQVREMRAEKRSAKADQPGAKRRMNRKGGGMFGGAMLRMADANRDGQVTLQEATSGAARHFDMVDTNRDGSITREERRGARGMMKQMRAGQAG